MGVLVLELPAALFGLVIRLGSEVGQMSTHVGKQQVRHVVAETILHHHSLDNQIFSVLWQRVGRHLPATVTLPFGHVIQ
jgi:hypothetical protein